MVPPSTVMNHGVLHAKTFGSCWPVDRMEAMDKASQPHYCCLLLSVFPVSSPFSSLILVSPCHDRWV